MRIALWIASFIAGTLGSYYFIPTHAPVAGATLPQTVAVFETSLQSPITSSATSLTLTANSIRGGTTLSGYNCFTIDEGSAQAEYVCGTVSGTTVSSLTRGVDPSTGTSTNATLQFSHRRGANVKITDFPAIQIMKAMLNGEDTIPNLIKYASTVCSALSGNASICDKAYIDGVAVAGASNANYSTKGIVQMATGLQLASSTQLGSTAAFLSLPAQLATSSPGSNATTTIVVTQSNGKIDFGFLEFTKIWPFTGGMIVSASSTFTAPLWFGATTSMLAFTASSTATSSMLGNLTIAKTASTTGLIVSGVCTNCVHPTIVNSTSGACSTSASVACSATATCSGTQIVVGGGVQSSDTTSAAYATASYPSASNAWTGTLTVIASGGTTAHTVTTYAICVNP